MVVQGLLRACGSTRSAAPRLDVGSKKHHFTVSQRCHRIFSTVLMDSPSAASPGRAPGSLRGHHPLRTPLHRDRMDYAVHVGTRQDRRLVRRMHSGAADSPVIMPLSSWMMRIALTRSGLAAAMAPQAPSLALPVTAVGGAAEETISINASRLAAAFVWLIAINASRRRAPRRRNFGFQRRLYPL